MIFNVKQVEREEKCRIRRPKDIRRLGTVLFDFRWLNCIHKLQQCIKTVKCLGGSEIKFSFPQKSDKYQAVQNCLTSKSRLFQTTLP